MKQKFKKYDQVQEYGHKKYRQLLLAHLQKIVGQVDNFILTKEAQFDEKELMPFIYVGEVTNDWKAYIKKNKLKNTFAAGKCFVEELGEGYILKLLAQEGKGAKDKTVKEVNKILKKDNIYIEFVSELPNPKEETSSEEGDKSPLETIEEALEKYRAIYAQYQKDPSKVEEKNAVLKRLKRLCQQWRQAHENGATPTSKHAQIEKSVQELEAFFAKRQAARDGKTNDPEALAIREEKLYAKTLKFRNEFYASLAKGEIKDIAVVENQLEDMKNQLGEWNKFIKQSKQASYKDALKKLVEDYKAAQKTFNGIKKPLGQFFEAIEQQDVALATQLAKTIQEKL